ncbi:MAG TPA: hypothetical protein VF784_04765 [Anaerolineales bacterium]
MLKQDIVVGNSYVNDTESVIREIVEETDAHHVKFNEFELATGRLRPAPHQICHRRQFARWAQRAASAAEAARTHPYAAEAWLEAQLPPLRGGARLDQVKTAISGAPEQLMLPRPK